MNKKFKIISALLASGLIITPVSGIINQNNNIAKANKIENNNYKNVKVGDIINGKKVTKIKKINTLDIISEMYKENIITEKEYKNAISILSLRAYGGEDKIVYFHDAMDVYISHHTLTALGLFTGTAVLSYFLKIGVSIIGAISGWAISKYTYSNGIVAYLKKVRVPVCAGGHCLYNQYTEKYAFSHFRSQ